jgi:hypothetical protein
MIKMYCDICGKELSDDCHDVVNIDFNSFGTVGFTIEIDKYTKASELNLCVACAKKVVSGIENLRKIAKQGGSVKLDE